MPFDRDRYDDLIKRCAFNAEYWRGTIQDQSAERRAMTYTGSPKWSRVGSLVALEKRAAADGTTSAVIQPILDVTGSITVEFMSVWPSPTFQPIVLRQLSATGGLSCGNATGVNRAELLLYDAAGALARYIMTGIGSLPQNRLAHVLMTSIDGGTAGRIQINGVPATATLAGAGLAANGGPAAVISGGAFSFAGTTVLTRAWQGALPPADASCLWEAARPR